MKIYFGLDAGVKNLGYAVTDENYNVINVNGKNAMGVLSYDSANTAAERRGYRTARRRLVRRRFRLALLQEIFNDELMKKDSNFLHRLNENDLKLEDRGIEGKYSLFNDATYDDKKYYRQYPTIYHLREELMGKAPQDIRLLYLAVHHIIKYRGHFLNDGEAKEYNNILPVFNRINELLRERNSIILSESEEGVGIIPEFNLDSLSDLKDLISGTGDITKDLLEKLKNKNEEIGNKYNKVYISKKDKKQCACGLLNATTAVQKKIVNAMFGDKVNLSSFFGKETYPTDEVKGFYLSDDFDEVVDIQLLKDNDIDYELILQLKTVYDWYVLNDLLKGEENLSKAMVNIYEKHKQDLKKLKDIIKKYTPKQFDNMFAGVIPQKGQEKKFFNYSDYIGGGRFDGEKIGNNGRIGATCTKEDFYKYVKKVLNDIKEEQALPLVNEILTDIENDDFMPKIVSKNNSTIPYQLNMIELNKILQTAQESGQYDFLGEISDGMSNADKIKLLLKFRIPYYVGPVKFYKDGEKKSKNAWAVRKKEGRVTPWNFSEMIDPRLSNNEFIKRMVSKCTYLKTATLPKNSILFSKYNALNELNKVKINGDEMPVEVKQKLFDNVYLTETYKPTLKRIYAYLIGQLGYDKDIKLSGFDGELKGSMSTLRMYKNVLGEKVDKYPKMVEKMIFYSTIHPDSKMIESSIREEFGDLLTEDEIKGVKGFKFNGWSSLSAEFLAGYKYNGIKLCFDGEYVDIVDILYDTNLNLQEILNSKKCNFQQALQEYYEQNQIVESGEITYHDVDEMYCSPSVKRCVWQSFGLVKDLIKQTKIIPDKIFIECTRGEDEKKKGKTSPSRREIINAYYDEAIKISSEVKSDIEQLRNEKLANCTDMQLQSEKIFLYFMQLGKSAYTGAALDFEGVVNGSLYDVDHIIPQARIKDDSLNNKVLVEGWANKEKSDIYPIPPKFRQVTLWKKLAKAKLFSDEKVSRLLRTKEISKEEQEKFINRQLVETNQTVILIKDLLERYFKEITDKSVEIVLSKATNVSDFRKKYNLTKSREVNDFHHAFDAYLNIVVGNILNENFNHNRKYVFGNINDDIEDLQENDGETKKKTNKIERLLNIEVYKNNRELLNTIESQMDTRDVQIVKKIQKGKGELYKATLFPAEDNPVLYSRCQSKVVEGKQINPKCNTSKYGGYKNSGTAYFVVVDSKDKKGNNIRTIQGISIYDDAMIKLGKMTYADVFEKLKLDNAHIANIKGLKNSVLKVGALLDFGEYKLRLAGQNEKQLTYHNANQLYVTKEINDYMKEISIVIEKANKQAKKKSASDSVDDNVKLKIVEQLINRNQERKVQKNQNSKIVVLTKEKNIQIYNFFVKKISSNPYKNIPTYDSLKDVLVYGKKDFEQKNIYEQILLLLNIIVAFQCNAVTVDVSNLKYCMPDKNGKMKEKEGGKSQCKIQSSKVISGKKIYFISQCKSGLKEHRIPISK